MKIAIILTLGMIVDTNTKRAIEKFQAFADEANLKNQEGGRLLVSTLIPKLGPIFKLYNLGKLTEKELILKIQECLPLAPEKILEAWNSCCVITEQNRDIIKQIAEMQKQAKSEAMDDSAPGTPKFRFFIYSDTNESNFEHLKPELIKAGLDVDSIITTFKTGKSKEAIFEAIMNECDDLGLNARSIILLPNPASYPPEFQREEQNKIQVMKKIAKAHGMVESQYFTIGETLDKSRSLEKETPKPEEDRGFLGVKKLQEIIATFQRKSISEKAIEPLEEFEGTLGSNRFLELAKKGSSDTIMSMLSPFSAEHRFQIMMQLKDHHLRTIFHVLAENCQADLLCLLLTELREEERIQAMFMAADKLGLNAFQTAIMKAKPGRNQDDTVERLLNVFLHGKPIECIRAICEPYNGRSFFQTAGRAKNAIDYAIEKGMHATVVILVRVLQRALGTIKSKVQALKLQGNKKLEAERQMANIEAKIKPYLTKYAAAIEAVSPGGSEASIPNRNKFGSATEQYQQTAKGKEQEELELALAISLSEKEHKSKSEEASVLAFQSQNREVLERFIINAIQQAEKEKDKRKGSEATEIVKGDTETKVTQEKLEKEKQKKDKQEKDIQDPGSQIGKEAGKLEKQEKSPLAAVSEPVTLVSELRKAIFEELNEKLSVGDLDEQEFKRATSIVNEFVKDPENFDDNDATLRVMIKEIGDRELERLRGEMSTGQRRMGR